MEEFGASSETPIDSCLRRLRECDLFIGILGHRYGTVHPSGKSYTELEYDEAGRLGIPRLMFLAAGEFSTLIAERESDELFDKQKSFMELVANHTGQFIDDFANAEQLAAAVVKAIANQVHKEIGASDSDQVDTWLLISYVCNQIGFDTGIAVTNPDMTFFGRKSNDGACTFFYFGEYVGGSPPVGLEALESTVPQNTRPKFGDGLSPIAQRSQLLAVGRQLLFTLSSGGNLGMAATPGFQGYLLIRCEFPNARAVAFLSDVGAQKIGSLYHAEVIVK